MDTVFETPKPKLGALVECNDGPLAGKAFFVQRGSRHWADIDWITKHFGDYGSSVVRIPAAVLEAFRPGQPTSRDWSDLRLKAGSIKNVRDAREAVATLARGSGVEIGPGSSPFPVPLDCRVTYADRYSYDELVENIYEGQIECDIVFPDLITDFVSLNPVRDDSIDFFVACHVIEHSPNPILSIDLALRKLKKGGQLILVVPEKTRTFDRHRPVTPLEHLVLDFQAPSKERDEENFREFFSLAESFYKPDDGDFEHFLRRQIEEDYSIHFHTWTLDSFMEMLGWYQSNVQPFQSVWSHDYVDGGIEFYVNIIK